MRHLRRCLCLRGPAKATRCAPLSISGRLPTWHRARPPCKRTARHCPLSAIINEDGTLRPRTESWRRQVLSTSAQDRQFCSSPLAQQAAAAWCLLQGLDLLACPRPPAPAPSARPRPPPSALRPRSLGRQQGSLASSLRAREQQEDRGFREERVHRVHREEHRPWCWPARSAICTAPWCWPAHSAICTAPRSVICTAPSPGWRGRRPPTKQSCP
mmetsp:Transcript_16653/g.43807  ORF Transcript_16653/g.43807 Transcript_16653/m.43807 type:complete len:214 (-) Transcript_16653:183-824(-)